MFYCQVYTDVFYKTHDIKDIKKCNLICDCNLCKNMIIIRIMKLKVQEIIFYTLNIKIDEKEKFKRKLLKESVFKKNLFFLRCKYY